MTDPARGLLGGVVGANGVTLGAATGGTAALQNNGTFSFTPSRHDVRWFVHIRRERQTATPLTATITQCTSAACGFGGAPTAVGDTYTSKIATRFQISRPGVLVNDNDPSGLPLKAVLSGTSTCASLNSDGSFSATGPGSCTFSYNAVNSQNTPSASRRR